MSVLSRVIFDTDVTPPSTPLGLTATAVSSSRIDLSWSPATDLGGSGLVGYDLLRDSITPIVVGVQTTYSDTGLASSTSYSYRVRARDGNGNLSAYGSQVSATTQAVSGSAEYDWIDNPVGYTDHWVDPAKTSSGTGAQANPYTFNQMLTLNPPAGGRHRFILMPGQLSVTTAAATTKFPVLQPTWSGTAANPVLVKAQFPATRAGVQRSQMTIIRRTSGVGSILGTFNLANYWRVDGIKFEGGHGSQGADGGNEKAIIVLRNCTGWWVTRCWIDGEQADHTSQGSTNGAGIYMQVATFMVLRDLIIHDIGAWDSAAPVWQGIEWYDGADIEISYFTISDCYGLGVFQKGVQTGPAFQRNYIHHGIVSRCGDTCYHPYYVDAGPDPANHNYWYNLVADQRGQMPSPQVSHGIQFNVIVPPHRGTHFQNCTIIGCDEGLMFRPVGYGPDVSIQNCVFYQNDIAILFSASPSWGYLDNDEIVFDWNQYNANTSHVGDFANVTYTQWQQPPYNKDSNGTNAVPTFVNFAGGDLRTNGPAVCPDHWNKFGGGVVPRGAFQPYGCRTNV